MNITTIYGKAGSGKTTKMVEMILETKKDYVVLAPTNAAVENIYNLTCEKMGKVINRDKFKTIYSFFRIDYENDIVAGAFYYPSTIFIDEFGLMNKHLFKRCLSFAKSGGCKSVVMCGDVMQLNPIYINKQYISLKKLNKINDWWLKMSIDENNLFPSVVEHFHLSIFGTKKIINSCLILMGSNKRANNEVKNTLNAVYGMKKEYNFKFVEFFDVVDLIINQDFVFIASKYHILQRIYDMIYDRKLKKESPIVIDQLKIGVKTGFRRLYLTPGMTIIACQTVKNEYINGQELVFSGNIESGCLKCYHPMTNEEVLIHKTSDKYGNLYYPITPSYLLSVHKSQGRSIDKVVVCIDEMFDISMLYTAITRARNELMFYSKEPINERVNVLFGAAHVKEFKQLNVLVNNINNLKSKGIFQHEDNE